MSYVAPKCPLTIKPVITPYLPIALALAMTRVVVLLVNDKITEPYRDWVKRWSGADGWFTYLVNCQYCTSVWVGAAASPLGCHVMGLSFWWAPLIALALSQVSIILYHWMSDL